MVELNPLIESLVQPENDLERALLLHPAFRSGLLWGEPRFGHPEGKVIYHIREVLDNLELIPNLTDLQRSQLRLVTIAHDSFKAVEDKGWPRNWDLHHAELAYEFLQQYTDDPIVLSITRRHDEAFYAWRLLFQQQRMEEGQEKLNLLLSEIGDFLQLYYTFFVCDTRTGDKNLAPLKWFEEHIKGIEVISWS